MIGSKKLLDNFNQSKAGHPFSYYSDRCVYLDFRGNLSIHPSTDWGYEVLVLTCSHNISDGTFGKPVKRAVIVKEGAWICSRAILYNCIIGEGAIVACGAVVQNVEVPPHTIVEGNPARIVKVFEDGAWKRMEKGSDCELQRLRV